MVGCETIRFPLAVTILAMLSILASAARADKSPYDWAFVRLDYVRQDKVQQLRDFCDKVHGKATQARTDVALVEFFDISLKYSRLRNGSEAVPAALEQRIADLRKALEHHYIRNYLCFYDVLLAAHEGVIFYTLRKESDYQDNLFEGESAACPLARCLRTQPREERFIDFHHYAASDEPAAFFVEPVLKDGQPLGWLVLQCAVNKINSLFAGLEELGATGETFLVNHEGHMLTESNFHGDSTILSMRLDDQNITAKFAQGRGCRTVTDYRGQRALTSFEVVDFLGVKWLVVAKADEAEVVTEHFRQHRRYYYERILHDFPSAEAVRGADAESVSPDSRKTIKVDMDEFVRANHNELLRTVGVSTCTAVIATYPGKFGYLAHISPHDRVYGGDGTNLLGHVIKKIKTYDIYKYERPRVRFVIVARHNDSLSHIVDKLVDEGFLLSQLSVLHGPAEHYANVSYDYAQDRISVEWVPDQAEAERVMQCGRDTQNLGELVKQLLAGAGNASETQTLAGPAQARRNHQ